MRLCSAVLTVVLLEEFGSLTDWASAGLEVVRCCSRCRCRFEPEPGSRAACLSRLGLALAVACRRCGLDDNDDGSDHDNAGFEAFEFAVGDAGWLCFPCPVHVPCSMSLSLSLPLLQICSGSLTLVPIWRARLVSEGLAETGKACSAHVKNGEADLKITCTVF